MYWNGSLEERVKPHARQRLARQRAPVLSRSQPNLGRHHPLGAGSSASVTTSLTSLSAFAQQWCAPTLPDVKVSRLPLLPWRSDC